MIIVDRQAPTTPEHTHAFESKQTYHDRQRPTVEAAVDEDLVRVDGEEQVHSLGQVERQGRGGPVGGGSCCGGG